MPRKYQIKLGEIPPRNFFGGEESKSSTASPRSLSPADNRFYDLLDGFFGSGEKNENSSEIITPKKKKHRKSAVTPREYQTTRNRGRVLGRKNAKSPRVMDVQIPVRSEVMEELLSIILSVYLKGDSAAKSSVMDHCNTYLHDLNAEHNLPKGEVPFNIPSGTLDTTLRLLIGLYGYGLGNSEVTDHVSVLTQDVLGQKLGKKSTNRKSQASWRNSEKISYRKSDPENRDIKGKKLEKPKKINSESEIPEILEIKRNSGRGKIPEKQKKFNSESEIPEILEIQRNSGRGKNPEKIKKFNSENEIPEILEIQRNSGRGKNPEKPKKLNSENEIPEILEIQKNNSGKTLEKENVKFPENHENNSLKRKNSEKSKKEIPEKLGFWENPELRVVSVPKDQEKFLSDSVVGRSMTFNVCPTFGRVPSPGAPALKKREGQRFNSNFEGYHTPPFLSIEENEQGFPIYINICATVKMQKDLQTVHELIQSLIQKKKLLKYHHKTFNDFTLTYTLTYIDYHETQRDMYKKYYFLLKRLEKEPLKQVKEEEWPMEWFDLVR